jgi:hypothetical protein
MNRVASRETATALAQSFLDGDASAWKPFIDCLIEMGYEKIASLHYRSCIDGLIKGDDYPCSLIMGVLGGMWTALEVEENFYKYRS